MINPLGKIESGIKICAQMSPEASEADFQFVLQMGIRHAVLWIDAPNASSIYYQQQKDRFAEYGIEVFGLGNLNVDNQDAIVLNLENRDKKIEEYKQHLWNLGKAGIPYTTYAHMGNGIWSTGQKTLRGGASARTFDLNQAESGHWNGQIFSMPLSHTREYSQEEIWDNYIYFIKQVAPVAEEAGVLIGIHPDDPPVPYLAGIPRCIFSSFEGYRRALEIADSPNVGICFCVGCWLEGGELMGMDILDSIRYFADREKIFKVHFRNVDQPLPHFTETFVDNGYMDMYQVMKVLHQYEFKGVVIPDHIPTMGSNNQVGTAYTIAYMKAMYERAMAESAN